MSDYCWFEIKDQGLWHAWTRANVAEQEDLAYAPSAPAVCSTWGGHVVRTVAFSWNFLSIPSDRRCAACFAVVAPALAKLTTNSDIVIGNIGPALPAKDPSGFVAYVSEVAVLTRKVAELEHERDTYRAMVADLLAAAHPHPIEHPTMSKQWARARALLKDGPSPLPQFGEEKHT